MEYKIHRCKICGCLLKGYLWKRGICNKCYNKLKGEAKNESK